MSSSMIRVLLNSFKWNTDILLNTFLDCTDTNEFLEIANITNPFEQIAPPIEKENDKTEETIHECKICYSELDEENTLEVTPCGHSYCTDCWRHYITEQIIGEGNAVRITCATPKCPTLLEDLTIIFLLEDDVRTRHIYMKLLTQQYVDMQDLMRWCPLSDCSNVIKVQKIEAKPVGCNCGHIFCFKCAENWHEPVTCEKLKLWLSSDDDETELDSDDEMDPNKRKELQEALDNKTWIANNARKCPNCNVIIEKNGGCNHIHCRKCEYHFCWICRGNWQSHRSCNVYTEQEEQQRLVAEVEAARNDLQMALSQAKARKERRKALARR